MATAFLWGCASAPSAVARGGGEFPILGSAGPLLLQVQVDGRGPYAFVLDTGSSTTVVSPRLVSELKLPVEPDHREVVDAEGSLIEVQGHTRIREWQSGNLSRSDVDALMMDLDALERALGEHVDGITGYSLFRDVTLVIDAAAGRASWTSERVRGRDGLRLRARELPVVDAVVNGQPTPILIDSGSVGAWMLPPDEMAATDVAFAGRHVVVAEGHAGRPRRRMAGEIRLGSLRFAEPLVEPTSGRPRVGWRVLRDYRTLIDQRSGVVKLELQRESADAPIRGIGAHLRARARTWEVWGVEPNMPAYQVGIRDGETVLAVNGRRVNEIGSAELDAMIQDSARVRLDVLRSGGVESVYVPVVYIQP